MNRRKAMIFCVLAGAVIWGGCERSVPSGVPAGVVPSGSPGAPEAVAAVVDGIPITAGALEEEAGPELKKLYGQIYQVKRRVLDGMIETMLIERAAARKGMSPQAFLAEEVDAKLEPPTEEQVEAFYEQQKARIREPLDQVREKVAAYLQQGARNEVRGALVARLRKEVGVTIALEPPRAEIPLDGAAYSLGEADAPVVLVEFSDYQCPYSKRAQEVLGRVLDAYPGKIRYAFFDFPLPFHKEAAKAHEAVRCAGEQGQAHAYGRKVFEDPQRLGVEQLKSYARELGLDTGAFDACLDGGRFTAGVERSVEKGRRLGVTGTPAFFVNGVLISGAQPFEAFQAQVDQELERGR